MSNLDLGLIGNCTVAALIDRHANIVWSCLPRFDGDPIFSRLLDDDRERGFFGIELLDMVRAEQAYLPNTAILVTRLVDRSGDGVEITDFAPRFFRFDRMFRPTTLMRMITPIGETPRIRVRLRPLFDYGETEPDIFRGSNHIRYAGNGTTLRLTSNAPLTYLLDETPFLVEQDVVLMLGPDESLRDSLVETARQFLEATTDYWRTLTTRLNVPFDWQEAVIRSAITLKLCSFEETGAIVAAHTTSIPEMDGAGRNWDYRYCWLRDAFFVVRTLNRLGYIETMEQYLVYLNNIVADCKDGHLQPVYGIGLEKKLTERQIDSLAGYRGNRPIRVGNQAFEHHQHDGYGSVILAASQAFFDERLHWPAAKHTFKRAESVGEQAFALHDVPDAGLWEFRTKAQVHTYSSVMCWAACDRLARIAAHLDMADRADYWREKSATIRRTIETHAWNAERNSYADTFGGDSVDASLLLMQEVGFLKADDPKFLGTLAAIEQDLRHGPYIFRYVNEDDFGKPENAFLVCTFWYIDALVAVGRKEEARELFEIMLARRNHLGLLSEHINLQSNELLGNFPQTYSHVGLINCATKLSRHWDDVV